MKPGIRSSLTAWIVVLLLACFIGGSEADFSWSLVRTEAPPQTFSVSHLGPGQGLSHTHALSVLQDQAGFVWVGTRFGLNRFDAYEFVSYFHNSRNPKGLGGNAIWRLMEDARGRLWIATWGTGLDCFDPRTETFSHYRHDPRDPGSLGSDHVWCLFEDSRGVLWVGTDRGLDRLDPETGRFFHYRHDPNDPASLSHDSVSDMAEAEDGILWVGTWRRPESIPCPSGDV